MVGLVTLGASALAFFKLLSVARGQSFHLLMSALEGLNELPELFVYSTKVLAIINAGRETEPDIPENLSDDLHITPSPPWEQQPLLPAQCIGRK